jgi:hypothetical protein
MFEVKKQMSHYILHPTIPLYPSIPHCIPKKKQYTALYLQTPIFVSQLIKSQFYIEIHHDSSSPECESVQIQPYRPAGYQFSHPPTAGSPTWHRWRWTHLKQFLVIGNHPTKYGWASKSMYTYINIYIYYRYIIYIYIDTEILHIYI